MRSMQKGAVRCCVHVMLKLLPFWVLWVRKPFSPKSIWSSLEWDTVEDKKIIGKLFKAQTKFKLYWFFPQGCFIACTGKRVKMLNKMRSASEIWWRLNTTFDEEYLLSLCSYIIVCSMNAVWMYFTSCCHQVHHSNLLKQLWDCKLSTSSRSGTFCLLFYEFEHTTQMLFYSREIGIFWYTGWMFLQGTGKLWKLWYLCKSQNNLVTSECCSCDVKTQMVNSPLVLYWYFL